MMRGDPVREQYCSVVDRVVAVQTVEPLREGAAYVGSRAMA